MQPEASFWLRQRRRAGRRSDDIVQGWWSRRFARDVRRRMRTCITGFGNAEPTQVGSLTRHNTSFKKPHKPKTLRNVSGSRLWCHDPGLCKTRSWVSGVNLGVWGRLGNAQRSADQARGMVCSHHSGCVKLSWANPGTLEIAQ